MTVHTTYAVVKSRYVAELRDILARLPRSSSREKNRTDEENFRYEFSASERIDGHGERNVESRMKATRTVLIVRVGRWVGSQEIPNPPEVEARYRESEEKSKAERARFAALSPEQQEAELNENLRELRKSPGFMAFYK